ncbi:sigma-E processing peptidase SpoIIGA, partial [Pseudoflavonifractor sp. An44]|uniref:sigma-E processing peptidase SpoIIGA n=1 Tax=Pseudoflavonifractor sp. An44 TaxID=1965635 RepID=UPI00117B8E79
RLAGAGLRRWRIALGAALGALYAVALFLPGMGWLSTLPCKLAVAVVMVLCAYGGEVRLWRVLGLFFAASAALAGAVLGFEWLGNTTLTLQSGVLYTQMDLRLLLVVFLACYFVFSLLLRRLGAHTGAELVHMELTFPQRVVSMTALHDTGLSLADPVTNRPVVVAYWRDMAWLLPAGADVAHPIECARLCHDRGIHGVRLVPYRAVGVESGMLLAFPTQQVRVNGRDMGSLLLALSPTPVSDGGSYQGLFGGI